MLRPSALLLIAIFPLLCWLAMQTVHEAGHILAAWATGGQVTDLVLHPLAISRTDVAPNPRPLIVAWAGPLTGAFAPLLAHGLIRRATGGDRGILFPFFAGFCLIANGAYLGVGVFDSVGDAGDLSRLGVPNWVLVLFGICTIPAGIWMWDGLPRALRHASWHLAATSGGLFAGVVALNLMLDSLL